MFKKKTFKPKFRIYIRRCGHLVGLPKTYPSFADAYAEVKKKNYKPFKIVVDNWPTV